MRKHLYLVGLLLMLLAASDGAHQSPSHAAGRGRHRNPSLETKKSAQKTTKLVESMETKRADPERIIYHRAKVAKFEFDDDELKQQLLDNGNYKPRSILPYQLIVDFAGGVNTYFVSTPMVKSGIPASLSTASRDWGFLLKPYPRMDVHRTTEETITDCSKQIVSVAPITKTFRKTWRDVEYLCALDTGVLNILSSPNHVCPPKIIIFDLETDEIVNMTIIENAACNSLYVAMSVDTRPEGGLVAYSADSFGFRLTVTDLTNGSSRHLQSQYFYPKPGFFFTKAGGPSTYLAFGLAGIAADSSPDGKVYMQAFASNIQGEIDKQVIHGANDGQVMDTITQVAIPGELKGTSGPLALDPSGELLFFPIQDEMAIYCWNTSKPHHPRNFRLIAQDKQRMQYISSMQTDQRGHLWVLTNRFPAFVSNALNYSDDNIYIMNFYIRRLKC